MPEEVEGSSVWSVYLLPATTREDVLPAGGSHRLDVDLEGTAILRRRTFSRSCVELKNEPRAIALTLTHLLDPTPTEIHVFLGLLVRKALVVVTADNAYVWEIRNGTIRFVQKIDRK